MSEADVTDLSLAVAEGEDVNAYLVASPDGEPRGGVLFLHWFDPEQPDGNRTQFLDEAQRLASDGLTSLLPQQVFPWSADPLDSMSDSARIEAELARLTVCLSVLETGGARRIVVVGHDFGAMHAALLMARDDRIGAGVLIAPANRWGDWFLRFWPIDEDRIDYLRAMRPMDPIEHVASLAPRPVLMQFAESDFFIAGMDAAELYRAAGEPRDMRHYDADHALRHAQAAADRRAFILDHTAA